VTRIPIHTLASAPDAARPLLEAVAQRSLAAGKLLNIHAAMAHAPVVLASYMGIRQALDEHGTFDPKTRAAILLTVSTVGRCAYTQAVNTLLAKRAGWTDWETAALRSGGFLDDAKLAALLAVAGEAAGNAGHVGETTWQTALDAGWSDEQLAEAFAYVAITLYVNSFIAYARTEFDVPAEPLLR
jgi:alkylhydroperoxidase family enzyme